MSPFIAFSRKAANPEETLANLVGDGKREL